MDQELYQTKNFIVLSADKPNITRTDGGHLKILPKVKVVDRTKLSPELAIEYIRLSMVIGEALATVMNEQGIDVGRINYQDNGNWSVFNPEGSSFHVHVYGRAKSAKIQKWGEMIEFPKRAESDGFFDDLKPLNSEDVKKIQAKIDFLFKQEKYQDKNWHL